MPTLGEHQSQKVTKMLLLGDSGTGKTSATISLIKAGYELFFADFDNGLDYLANKIKQEKNAEELLSRVHYLEFQDQFKSSGGKIIPKGMPKAWPSFLKTLDHWKDEEEDFGAVSSWDDSRIFVLDSLTFASNAALRYVLATEGRLGQPPQIQDWGEAMRQIENMLDLLYSSEVKTNVLVMSHIISIEGEDGGGSKGAPSAIGSKLPPKIPRYFNTMVRARTKGTGDNLKRIIRTNSDSRIELKTATTNVPSELPLETGLETLFTALRGGKPRAETADSAAKTAPIK